jgi:hypothetical protein
MTIKNLDKYLDPSDEPEVPLCESCGHEMPILDDFGGQKYVECVNLFCPDKHTGIAREMAELIVDQAETIDELKTKIRRLELVNNSP